jgi:hypothetical protein
MFLIRDAEDHLMTQESEELASHLGLGSTRAFQSLMKTFADSDMDAGLDWNSGGSRTAARVTPRSAEFLRNWLASVEEQVEQIDVTGILHGGDDLVGRFKLVGDDGRTFEGKADAELLEGKTFGSRYRARIDVVTSTSDYVGAETARYVLRGLQIVTDE